MSNTPKEQTAVINRLHITTPTNADGIGEVENPYKFIPVQMYSGETNTENYKWGEFRKMHPPLPVIDHLTGNLLVGWTGEVTGPVWQFLGDYYSTGKLVELWKPASERAVPLFKTFERYAKYWAERKIETRLVYLTLADEQPAHLKQPPTEDKQPGETVEEVAEKTTVLRYQIPEQGMPKPPTTFEGKYGFPMSDLNFDSPMNFVWTLGAKSNMDNQEKRTLLEVIQMYLEGANHAVEEKESVKGGETVSLEAVINIINCWWHASNVNKKDIIIHQIRNLTGRE